MRKIRGMTVRQLIDALEEQDEDAIVVFTADYGDHSHTMQALPIEGNIENMYIVESAYSDSGFAISGDDDELSGDEQCVVVVR